VNFAFIGLGFAGRELHVPAVRALDGATIVGGCDVSDEHRRSWELGVGSVTYADAEAMLDAVCPDVVVVSTPPDSHARYCMLALETGANVICEKPFVATADEANEVLTAAGRAGRQVAVNHEFRFMPIFRTLQNAIGSAGVGRPMFFHCTQFMDLPPWRESVAWRSAMSNRSLFEGGVHLVDLIVGFAGRLPVAVSAMTSSGPDAPRPADAIHLVTLDFGEGMLGQITIDRLCRAGTRYVDLRVDCEDASLRASYGGRAYVQIGVKRGQRPGVRVDFGREGLAWSERGLRRTVLARNPRRSAAAATGALYRATTDAWRSSVKAPTDATIARDVLRVIAASYQSAETGERVLISADV
jgi:predicted dehydrogenase